MIYFSEPQTVNLGYASPSLSNLHCRYPWISYILLLVDVKHIIRVQSFVRRFLVRERLRKVRQEFMSISKEIGDDSTVLDWLENVAIVQSEQPKSGSLTEEMNLPEERSKVSSLTNLYKTRNELFLEILWLDQAIKSRIDFLKYKEKFDDSVISNHSTIM